MILDRFRLDDTVAVVTGAGRGIGAATALALAEAGADVVLSARTGEQLAAVAASVEALGRRAVVVPADLSDLEAVAGLVERARESFGRLDIVVNNVGGAMPRPFLDTSAGRMEQAFHFNVATAHALLRPAVPLMLEHGGGSVVNISSGAPRKTTPSMAAYAAAKAALNALTRTIAADLGPRGVRVNAVSPGLTKTSFTRPMWEKDGGRDAGAKLILGRMTEADDIAAACAFLLSDDARQITGVVLDVDGGNHLSGGWSPFTSASSS